MPSLKDLRNRISSVRSTKKITSAMKMVAAAKLKRAQDNAEKSRPYANKMKEIVLSLISKSNTNNLKFSKTNNKKTVLLIVCSADRGLCGGFNGSIIKYTKNLAHTLKNDGKNFKFLFVGKKAYQSLRRIYKDLIIDLVSDFANPKIEFEVASSIRDQVLKLFFDDEISECYLIYTKFKSAISQNVESQKLLPIEKDDQAEDLTEAIMYDFEPDEEVILDDIIPKNIAIQIHSALLENLASEQGSRMTAMDNATRNANDMIDRLTLFYNRSRQALITKELIEIISGAEAV
ncbi:MAG: F0F1 ATP synthase subunit gamma [Rickettsiales bacterium]|nr:F0F1 ATP synthase subunit gamma [Rickettsiales bacterium]RPG13342.1 MAG: F0F1 ATP synthase subunit gamma [Pelagibacteraceae bacterium TMED195]|tara:strand:- start:3564 stop:4433 length:870 start_codon:yes stop_codon:yes gene_type:complete